MGDASARYAKLSRAKCTNLQAGVDEKCVSALTPGTILKTFRSWIILIFGAESATPRVDTRRSGILPAASPEKQWRDGARSGATRGTGNRFSRALMHAKRPPCVDTKYE